MYRNITSLTVNSSGSSKGNLQTRWIIKINLSTFFCYKRSDLTNSFEHNYGDIELYQWYYVVL